MTPAEILMSLGLALCVGGLLMLLGVGVLLWTARPRRRPTLLITNARLK